MSSLVFPMTLSHAAALARAPIATIAITPMTIRTAKIAPPENLLFLVVGVLARTLLATDSDAAGFAGAADAAKAKFLKKSHTLQVTVPPAAV
jgi:hypothetical protein